MLDIFAYVAFAGLCVIIIMAAVELFIDVCEKISGLFLFAIQGRY